MSLGTPPECVRVHDDRGEHTRFRSSSADIADIHVESKTNSEPLKPWQSGEPHKHSLGKDGDAWEKCYNVTKEFDKQMCEAWRDEVQNLLIFAGLFSAVVTAFTIESYKLLQNNTVPNSADLLKQLLMHLSDASTLDPASPSSTSSPSNVTRSAVRINILWFLSLTLSLTTVLIGILCLQWIREYQRYGTLLPKDALALRQMRYEGLVTWKVPNILSGLPVLLQAAFVLFFAGLLDLLWMLNREVAAVLGVVVGLVLFFLAATTVLPAAQSVIFNARYAWLYIPQCPYKSPQSWGFYRLGFNLVSFIQYAKRRLLGGSGTSFTGIDFSLKSAWFGYDLSWSRSRESGSSGYDHSRALVWIGQMFMQSHDIIYAIHHCMGDISTFAAALTCWTLWHPNIPFHSSHSIRQSLHNHNNVLRDLVSAYTLLYFSTANSRLRLPLLLHRLELYIRIKNSNVPNNLGETGLAPEDLACPNIHFWYFENKMHIPNDMKLQLLYCIASLLNRNEASDSDLRTLCTIIENFPGYAVQTQQQLSSALSTALFSLQKWTNCSAPFRTNRRDAIINIIFYQFKDHTAFAHSFKQLAGDLAGPLNALKLLIHSLNESVVEIGFPNGPSRWKQPWREFVELLLADKVALEGS